MISDPTWNRCFICGRWYESDDAPACPDCRPGTREVSELSEAAEQARDWTEVRNIRIRRAREQGMTLRQIGEEAGLTHAAIAKILAKATEG